MNLRKKHLAVAAATLTMGMALLGGAASTAAQAEQSSPQASADETSGTAATPDPAPTDEVLRRVS